MEEIAVVGGGSVGLLFAGRMAAAGLPVTVWTRSEAQAESLNRNGIEITPFQGEEPLRAKVNALTLAEAQRAPGRLVFLAVKQTAINNEFLALLAAATAEDNCIMALCNGIGHTDRLAQTLPGRPQVAAVTTEAALRVNERKAAHTGLGETWLGPAPLFESPRNLKADSPNNQEAARKAEIALQQAGFTVSVSNDMTDRILRKLLMNAVINPLTAIWRVPNGELAATSERLRIMHELFAETLPILVSCGLQDNKYLWDSVIEVVNRTAGNRSSMLEDVLAGRRTEIDAINGAICRLAERAGLQADWNNKVAALVGTMNGG